MAEVVGRIKILSRSYFPFEENWAMWAELSSEEQMVRGMGRSRPAWLTHSRDRLPKRADLARFFTEPRCRTESYPQSYFLHKGGKPLVVAPKLVWN